MLRSMVNYILTLKLKPLAKKKICEMKMSQLQNAKTFLHEEKKQVIRFQKGGRCSYRLEEFI